MPFHVTYDNVKLDTRHILLVNDLCTCTSKKKQKKNVCDMPSQFIAIRLLEVCLPCHYYKKMELSTLV